MPQWAILLWGGTLPLGLSRSPEVQLQQLASMVGTSRSALGNLLEATASLGVLPDAAHHLASCLRPCHICFTLASASCAVTGAAPGVPWLDTTSTVTFLRGCHDTQQGPRFLTTVHHTSMVRVRLPVSKRVYVGAGPLRGVRGAGDG
eukprot:363017-Chlamydomonas_euryale.AAC.6